MKVDTGEIQKMFKPFQFSLTQYNKQFLTVAANARFYPNGYSNPFCAFVQAQFLSIWLLALFLNSRQPVKDLGAKRLQWGESLLTQTSNDLQIHNFWPINRVDR
jgi:hypothetical protein